MLYESGGYNLKGEFRPVWERGPKGGFALGSLGAFLVLESREHAEKRGAKPLARLSAVVSDRSPPRPGAIKQRSNAVGQDRCAHSRVRPPSFPAPAGASRRPARSARSSPSIRTFPCAPPGA